MKGQWSAVDTPRWEAQDRDSHSGPQDVDDQLNLIVFHFQPDNISFNLRFTFKRRTTEALVLRVLFGLAQRGLHLQYLLLVRGDLVVHADHVRDVLVVHIRHGRYLLWI